MNMFYDDVPFFDDGYYKDEDRPRYGDDADYWDMVEEDERMGWGIMDE